MKILYTIGQKNKIKYQSSARMKNITQVFFYYNLRVFKLWGTFFLGNIIFNLVFGFIGDKFGWKNTIIWFGGVGCAIFTPLLLYIPVITNGSMIMMGIVGFV